MRTAMDCSKARELNVDRLRGALATQAVDALRDQLSTCAACRAHAEAEQALSDVLETRLPRYAAPAALQRRIAAGWPASGSTTARAERRPWWRAPQLAVGAALSAVLAVGVGGATAVVV